ncbi:protein of unknown function [Candidatus Filomicrobium marinum]|uniref:Uncharacterized protein n=1 Tax=Candidatus Filomicrobium marinum TaxID=1608628 RepID=A0A0D6JIT3_9HYPH|nr:protein of unknown function [Candidatus Filomicrobium marinum]
MDLRRLWYGSGGMLDQEAIYAAAFFVFQQGVSGCFAERLEVGDRSGIGGQDLKGAAAGNVLDDFFGFQDWQRTIQTLCIQCHIGHGRRSLRTDFCFYRRLILSRSRE